MKLIEVPPLIQLNKNSPLILIAQALDELPQHAISETPWWVAGEKPEVKFSIAYNKDCIFLKYYVNEKTIQAKYLKTNDPVYKDSCVEFFIAFNGEKSYYNLEFNCLGTCRAGFGQNRHDRKLLPEQEVFKVKSWIALQVANSFPRQIMWQLTLVIPAEVFSEHRLTNFAGEQAQVNFYKCGDELPDPHYLSWSNINYPEPNFHLPEFFGQMRFIKD